MRIHRFNGSFLSLLIITTATILLAGFIFAKTFPLLSAKALYFCQQFISNNLLQIPNTIPSALLLTLIIALMLSSLSFFIQIWKTKRLVRRLFLNRIPLSKRIEDTVSSVGLAKKVYHIKDRNTYSFCTGIFSTKILITTSLTSLLDDKELEAVLLHEKAHMNNHDPLKLLFGKTVSWLFFFLPIFSEMSKNMEATSEILADWFVASAQREDTYLRSALKKILLTPQIALASVPAIANPDYLEIRISRLVNPAIKHSFSISWKSIVTSILFFILSIFVIQTPVSAFSMENQTVPSYFVCSSDNACSQQCNQNAQVSPVISPAQLFSSQAPNYQAPSYK